MKNEYNGVDLTTGKSVLVDNAEMDFKLTKSSFNLFNVQGKELENVTSNGNGLRETFVKNAKMVAALENFVGASNLQDSNVKEHLNDLSKILKNSPELSGANSLNFIVRKHTYDNNKVGEFNETLLFVHNPKNDVMLPLTRIINPENGAKPEFASIKTPIEGLKGWFNSFVNFHNKNNAVKFADNLVLSENIYQTEYDFVEGGKLKLGTQKMAPEFKVAKLEPELENEFDMTKDLQDTPEFTKTLSDEELLAQVDKATLNNPSEAMKQVELLTAKTSMKGMPKFGEPGFNISQRMTLTIQNRQKDVMREMYSDIYNQNTAGLMSKINSGELTENHINADAGYSMKLAAYTGNKQGLEALIENGGNINTVDPKTIHDPELAEYIKFEQEKKNNPLKHAVKQII